MELVSGQRVGENVGDGCEWRTELVGDDGDKVVLGLILDELSPKLSGMGGGL